MTLGRAAGLFQKARELLPELAQEVELRSPLRRSQHDGMLPVVVSEALLTADTARDTKSWRVRKVLDELGRPAHYSAIADEYNHLYPDDYASENSIHAILSREEHGVVWTGARGAYGLEEAGVFRPVMSYAQAVLSIVTAKYGRTSRPVPFAVVAAEIGKYRYAPNLDSVRISLDLHPDLRRLEQDTYVPIERDIEEESRDMAPVKVQPAIVSCDDDGAPARHADQAKEKRDVDGTLASALSIVELLRSLGLEVIDQRSRSGAVWVVGGDELAVLFDEARLKDMGFRYQISGWSCTRGRSAWRSYNIPD